MEPRAIATNELGMHVIVRPVPNSLLLDGTVSEIGTEDVNALMTARRPASLADAIGGLPPLLPPSADSVGDGKRLYSLDEVRSGSGGLRLDSPVPELLQYESQLDVNTTLDSSLASAKSAAKKIPFSSEWVSDTLADLDPTSTMVAVEPFADWALARNIVALTAKLLGLLSSGSETPMQDAGFVQRQNGALDLALWYIPFAFNPFFAPTKRSLKSLRAKLSDYHVYQPLYGILTHQEEIKKTLFEHTYAEVFGSVPYGEQGAVFVLTAPVASENYISLLGGWKDAKERHYMLCVGVGKSQRDDAKNVVNALTESVSKLRLPGSSAILGWTADKSARFSARPVPSVKRESLLSELLYRVVYRGNSRIGICASCGSPFIQDETGPLRDVCSQACRMTLRRRNGLA